jgi:formylglycine-generating enzyme required for sulfatase activity
MPPGLGDAFDVPADTKDAHGNAIRQATHEKTGYPLEIRHKATGMHFVFIPAGEFIMGSPKDEKGRDDDEKQHKVTLAKPFYMGKYEVTAGQFKAFVRAATYRTDAEKDGWAYAWTGNSGARLTALHGRNRGLSRRRNTRSPR